jgi:hypothetical protein
MLRKGTTRKPKHRITELAGLGKEIWEGVDVEEYIRQSRGPHEPENPQQFTTQFWRSGCDSDGNSYKSFGFLLSHK